jgi:hypothetical protein
VAKTKPTTLKDFFNGRRRKAVLKQWTHLKTRAGEPRVKLELKLPMLNEDAIGIPEPILQAFAVMEKDESRVARTNINVQFLGMTIEGFSSDTGGAPGVSQTGGMIHGFSLQAEGEGEKRTVDLHCTAYLPANVQLRDWCWDHNHSSFFLSAEYSQSEMEFGEEQPPAESEDDEDEEPAEGEPAEPATKEEELEHQAQPQEVW